jgi:hypothetical protein
MGRGSLDLVQTNTRTAGIVVTKEGIIPEPLALLVQTRE